MKKVLTALVALCYLVFASGFTVNVHYCMGKVDGISIGVAHPDKCNTCGMHTASSKGCCKDESSFYKIDDNHAPSFLGFAFQAPDLYIRPFSPFVVPEPFTIYNNYNYYTDTSPLFLIKDRCVVFSNFRI